MVERVCRSCGAGNPAEALRCGMCGSDLEQLARPAAPLARRAPAGLAARLRSLPALSGPTGRKVALGLAAIAVEVGATLLREHGKRKEQSAGTALARPTQRSARAAVRQRVWEEFDADGRLRRRVVENLLTREDTSQ